MTDWRKVEDRILCGMMIVVMAVLTALVVRDFMQ